MADRKRKAITSATRYGDGSSSSTDELASSLLYVLETVVVKPLRQPIFDMSKSVRAYIRATLIRMDCRWKEFKFPSSPLSCTLQSGARQAQCLWPREFSRRTNLQNEHFFIKMGTLFLQGFFKSIFRGVSGARRQPVANLLST